MLLLLRIESDLYSSIFIASAEYREARKTLKAKSVNDSDPEPAMNDSMRESNNSTSKLVAKAMVNSLKESNGTVSMSETAVNDTIPVLEENSMKKSVMQHGKDRNMNMPSTPEHKLVEEQPGLQVKSTSPVKEDSDELPVSPRRRGSR